MPIFLICACHSGDKAKTTGDLKTNDTTRKNFLPLEDYLKSEIAAVDSFPLRIMKYRIEKGKTDSVLITTAEFDRIAREFLQPGLDSSNFENHFEENSFIDRSTNLVSFTYASKDTGNGVKRVDILLSPGAGSDKLSSIYMEAISGKNDSTLISKLSWKAGRNFRIIHIKKPRTGPEVSSQTVVVWDTRD